MRFFSWLTPTLVVGMLFGGLAGAVFTWWVNREPPLTVGYLISSTSTGADVTTKSLVPRLTLRIDEKDIPAIHVHSISLSRTSGYADRVDLAATFSQPVQVFGSAFEPPSPVHTIECQMIPSGSKCNLGPMDGHGEYRISLATDSASPPQLAVAGRNIQLASLAEVASRSNWTDWLLGGVIGAIATILSLISLAVASGGMWKRDDVTELLRKAAETREIAEHALTQVGAEFYARVEEHPHLKVGTRVKHDEYGVGTITKLEKHEDDWKITVNFDKVGFKKLLEKYAKLEIAHGPKKES